MSNALPIDHMTIFVNNTNPFVAGVSTNSVGNVIVFVNTFDSFNNPPSAGETVFLQLLDNSGITVVADGMLPASFITRGTGQINGGNDGQPYTFFKASTSLRLRAYTASGVTATNASNFTVIASSATKLLMIGPGMTHVPGTNPSATDGISGVFTPQEANQPFTITVILTDNQFNTVNQADTVSFPAVSNVTLPGNTALQNGQRDFSITITAPKISPTITVTDVSEPTVANGSLTITTAGPPEEEVFPFPSPFNPKTGNITFRFRLTKPKSVDVIVVDRFGQKVWSRSVNANLGITDLTWDGKNDNGVVVAAGVYYVMLEVDGSISHKRMFGVVK